MSVMVPVWKRPPRAVYLHVPFCRRRCGYCNFTLVAGRSDLIQPYLNSIALEMAAYDDLPCQVDTIFLGGGTPSQVRDDHWRQLAAMLHRNFPLSADGEWSVEVNPEDVDRGYLEQLRTDGVTRVSLGVQSLSDDKLRTLERQHTGQQARDAIQLAIDIMDTVSADLIFAAPNETLSRWKDDLASVIDLGVDHISTYGLTFEQGAAFWSQREKGLLKTVGEELELDMYLLAIESLIGAGFEHYEISNFAQPGNRCRHNECYWTGATYHAIGPGAARHLKGRRETNHRSTTEYLRRLQEGRSPVAESDEADDRERALEVLVFGLRRIDGVDRDWFLANTGFNLDDLGGQALQEYREEGWLQDDGRRIALSRRGLVISDSLWGRLLAS
ncbi:MAG: radical SAM family heme chaperone HemW [Pirellulaceae bacterium]